MPEADGAAAAQQGTQAQAQTGTPTGQGEPSAELIEKVRAILAPEYETRIKATEAKLHGAESTIGRMKVASGWDNETVQAIVTAMTDRDAAANEAKAAGVPEGILKLARTAAEVREAAAAYNPRIAPGATSAAPAPDAMAEAIKKALAEMGVVAPQKPPTATMGITPGAGTPVRAGGESLEELQAKPIWRMSQRELREHQAKLERAIDPMIRAGALSQ